MTVLRASVMFIKRICYVNNNTIDIIPFTFLFATNLEHFTRDFQKCTTCFPFASAEHLALHVWLKIMKITVITA